LNRRILIGAAILVAVFASCLGYTLVQRREAVQGKSLSANAGTVTGPASTDSILDHVPSGEIKPTTASKSAAKQAVTSGTGSAQTDQVPKQSPAEIAAQQAAAARLMQEQQEELEISRQRLAAESAALDAPSTIDLKLLSPSVGASSGADLASVSGGSLFGGSGATGGSAGGAGFSAAGGTDDPNGQGAKAAFLRQPPTTSDYLVSNRESAVSPYELRAGAVIPAVMVSGINSDLPGQIIGQVAENVYDTATGSYLLIPQGAKLVGTYDNAVTYGQSRVLVVWNRIIFPDASSLDINGMAGADQGGYSGFSDQVNNHYVRIFGSALLLSLFSAGIQLSQPQASSSSNGTYTSQQIIAGAVGQQLGNTGSRVIERNLNIAPTLEIRPGYLFNVMVTKDIVVKLYSDGVSRP